MKFKEGDLILIEWLDSETVKSDQQVWYSLSSAKGDTISRTKTVGFLVEQTSDHVSISQSWQSWDEAEEHEPSIAGLFTIPNGCIKVIHKVYLRQPIKK